MIQGIQLGVPSFSYCHSDLACGSNPCLDLFGCPPNKCPDFVIRRYDTKPPFRVAVDDCDGPLNLLDPLLVLEANMWAHGRFKANVASTDTSFALADNVGFYQIKVGDTIVVDSVRSPEQMLVTGFDEVNYLVFVTRGYNSTTASAWKKGTIVRIFKVINSSAAITTVFRDSWLQEDGTFKEGCGYGFEEADQFVDEYANQFGEWNGEEFGAWIGEPYKKYLREQLGEKTHKDKHHDRDQIEQTLLVYEWGANDTCMPGCYWLEFKLLKMSAANESPTLSSSPCELPTGVDWIRRFPETSSAFLIQILDSPTSE